MTTKTEEQMKSWIKAAFSSARKPTEITRCPCEECRSLQRFFSNFESDTASVNDLRNHETLLIHGTAEAFRFFLPYFMIASVEGLNEAGAIPDLMLFAISTDADDRYRTGLLAASEIVCVNQFIDFLVASGDHSDDEVSAARDSLSLLEHK